MAAATATPAAPPPTTNDGVPNIAVDTDSSYGDDGVSAYTASLISSIVKYPSEHGRRYHAFRDGTYVFPNDEPEQERMDMHHEMYMRATDRKLHLAPLDTMKSGGGGGGSDGKEAAAEGKEVMKGKKILDIGTGTGIWCIEMGDAYPNAEVIGNDFSAIQPSMVPPNVKFEIDDVEADWTYPFKFDYIHSRFMAGSIADWPRLIRQCYDNLSPGGIIELQDGNFICYSEDGSIEGTAFQRWNLLFADAAKRGGRIVQPGLYLEQWVREAGFEDVHHTRIKLPLGIWPKDRRMKEVGAFNHVQLKDGLEGFSLRLFTGVLGWEPEEVQVMLADARKDLDNKKMHAQNDMHIVWARKPLA